MPIKDKKSIFIDTSGFVSVMVESDQYFKDASPFFRRSLAQYTPLITTNLVIAEAYPLIRRFSCHKNAMRFLEIIAEGSRNNYLEVSYTTAYHYQKAEDLLKKYQEHDLSLVDAVNMMIMKENGLSRVFGFDSHFRLEGYLLIPADL